MNFFVFSFQRWMFNFNNSWKRLYIKKHLKLNVVGWKTLNVYSQLLKRFSFERTKIFSFVIGRFNFSFKHNWKNALFKEMEFYRNEQPDFSSPKNNTYVPTRNIHMGNDDDDRREPLLWLTMYSAWNNGKTKLKGRNMNNYRIWSLCAFTVVNTKQQLVGWTYIEKQAQRQSIKSNESNIVTTLKCWNRHRSLRGLLCHKEKDSETFSSLSTKIFFYSSLIFRFSPILNYYHSNFSSSSHRTGVGTGRLLVFVFGSGTA